MTFDAFSRRRVLQGSAALAVAGAFSTRPAFAKDTMVGFVYVGSRDDYGYNQAHAEGAAALKKMAGVKVVEEEKVPETDAVEKTMESMINLDGATLIFPTSFGYYNPHVLKIAAKYPKVRFEHCGGLWTDKDPEERRQLFRLYRRGAICRRHRRRPCPARAASSASSPPSRSRRCCATSMPSPRRALGNPKATLQVIFTGDWSMPVKEAEATNSLIDQGVDVLTCHVDGPKMVMENAARRGAMVSGYHVSQATLAPKAYLTGAEWNWEAVYPKFVKMFADGETIPNFYRGGLKEGVVKMSPYGTMVSEEARKAADDVKAKLIAGTYVIFKGPLKDNKGNVVIAGGVSRGQTDVELEKMNYLVEGVIGATS